MKLSESEQKFLRRCGIAEKMEFNTAEPLVLKMVYAYLGRVGKNSASNVISTALQVYERNGDFKTLQDAVFKTLQKLEGYAKTVRDPNPLLGKNVDALTELMKELNSNGVTESKKVMKKEQENLPNKVDKKEPKDSGMDSGMGGKDKSKNLDKPKKTVRKKVVKEMEDVKTLDISGDYTGYYEYPFKKIFGSVHFEARITDNNGIITGNITENMHGEDVWADIKGKHDGNNITFTKKYRGKSHEVVYTGKITSIRPFLVLNYRDVVIVGKWKILGSWSGKFSMFRESKVNQDPWANMIAKKHLRN